jgi:hypothetical protein
VFRKNVIASGIVFDGLNELRVTSFPSYFSSYEMARLPNCEHVVVGHIQILSIQMTKGLEQM